MFTIKHIASNGDEYGLEAHSYQIKRDADGVSRLLTYDKITSPDDAHTSVFTGDRQHGAGPDTHSAYVMNRFGSTVATFHYTEHDWSAGMGNAGGVVAGSAGQLMNS